MSSSSSGVIGFVGLLTTSCEKCWDDAGIRAMETGKTKTECYNEITKERNDNPCTPKERAGQFWDEERQRDRRFFAT